MKVIGTSKIHFMEINRSESNKGSTSQGISGFCEVQRITVRINQLALSKYFNIVFLELLYENKQVFVALINNLFEARSFLNNTADYSGDIFYRNNARLWITGCHYTFFLVIIGGIDDLGSVSHS